MSQTNTPYLAKICEALVEVLTVVAQATPDRVAGYAANIDFWITEAEHRIKLLKGYEKRFRRFQVNQSAFACEHSIRWNERSGWTPSPKVVKPSLSIGSVRNYEGR